MATLGFIAIMLTCCFILWVLIEALYYDMQRKKFIDELYVGQEVLLGQNEVIVVSFDRENRMVLVSGLFHEPMSVDETRLYPIEGFKSFFRGMLDEIMKR